MTRIIILLGLILGCISTASHGQEKTPDTVDVYIVPMDDFPEPIAASIAKYMSSDMNIWAKTTLRLGDLDIQKLPGTNQLIAEDILQKAQPPLRALPESSSQTYFLLLTTRDINSASAGFRYQFSMHNKELNTSVVSMARMVNRINGQPVIDKAVVLRLYKMTKRAIGEIHLGWKRSSNIDDIMYSPLMGVPDLDRIGINHIEPGNDGDKKSVDKPPGPTLNSI